MAFYIPTKEYIKFILFLATTGILGIDLYKYVFDDVVKWTFIFPLVALWFFYREEQ